jgi:hypothetical protein
MGAVWVNRSLKLRPSPFNLFPVRISDKMPGVLFHDLVAEATSFTEALSNTCKALIPFTRPLEEFMKISCLFLGGGRCVKCTKDGESCTISDSHSSHKCSYCVLKKCPCSVVSPIPSPVFPTVLTIRYYRIPRTMFRSPPPPGGRRGRRLK